MKEHFHRLRVGRTLILKTIKDLTTAQLNCIPKGFNNNVIWNLGHILVTQQLLVYKLSGITPKVSQEKIDTFRKGTKPERDISATEVQAIIAAFSSTIDDTEEDYNQGIFLTYNEYLTSYGLTLTSTVDAIAFNNIHESLHLGYILALKRVLALDI